MTRSIYTGLLALALTAFGAAAAKESVSDSATGDLKATRAERAIGRSTSGPSLPDDPGNDQIRPDGRLALVVNSVAVGGRTYPLVADLTPVPHQMVGRGITKDEVERIGAGTAIGAVAG
ncbi:MAG TPA: hypothetical protein VL308_22740 [Gemmatimonadaceae bacterium]|nr:hypothetical protein [Gemmatimonadaceae bacterium]HVE35694.1 hypothetical protein [Gemmatimonadaceae bacterium]